MAEGGLMVLDGKELRSLDLSLPESYAGAITGASVLELAESRASSSLLGLTLQENLKLSALKRLNVDADEFRRTEIDRDQASSTLKDYITAIADELEGEPCNVLNSKQIRG